MIPGVEMITEGGTLATIRFSKNTGDCDYSLSVAVLIPSMFEDCTGRQDLETAVFAFGELHKKFFMDLYFQELLEADPRYECMRAFDGSSDASGYECFVDSVFPLTQAPYPMSSTFKIIDYSFEMSRD
jgi:hypothetical protein